METICTSETSVTLLTSTILRPKSRLNIAVDHHGISKSNLSPSLAAGFKCAIKRTWKQTKGAKSQRSTYVLQSLLQFLCCVDRCRQVTGTCLQCFVSLPRAHISHVTGVSLPPIQMGAMWHHHNKVSAITRNWKVVCSSTTGLTCSVSPCNNSALNERTSELNTIFCFSLKWTAVPVTEPEDHEERGLSRVLPK
jgi:hypothetical protein